MSCRRIRNRSLRSQEGRPPAVWSGASLLPVLRVLASRFPIKVPGPVFVHRVRRVARPQKMRALAFRAYGVPYRPPSFHTQMGEPVTPKGRSSHTRMGEPVIPKGRSFHTQMGEQLSLRGDHSIPQRAGNSSPRGEYSIPQWASQSSPRGDHFMS